MDKRQDQHRIEDVSLFKIVFFSLTSFPAISYSYIYLRVF